MEPDKQTPWDRELFYADENFRERTTSTIIVPTRGLHGTRVLLHPCIRVKVTIPAIAAIAKKTFSVYICIGKFGEMFLDGR